jgi:2-polyprenyl-3-methyl-5-hydroxy-6-metoxy-1,4-benzoquinol methylase
MKEADIRPEHLHRRYLELSARDAALCFNNVLRLEIPCVACHSFHIEPRFQKSGFGYARCSDCGTLYQSPRPPIEAFESFYRDSVSSRYWAEEFFPAVAEARRASIFRPRVERLLALCAERNISVERLIEVGSGFGIFLEEWRARSPGTELLAIEPSKKMAAVCREKGFSVAEDIVENVKGRDGYADLVVCFEVLEHVYDPLAFIKILGRLVRPGGYVFISTLCVDGFDIQTLWDKSNSISPPHHINFLSIEGFMRAFTLAGLAEMSITTPGKLDVDIVRNAFVNDPGVLKDNRFAQMLVKDPTKAEAFQNFLAVNQLSSHVWVLAKSSI